MRGTALRFRNFYRFGRFHLIFRRFIFSHLIFRRFIFRHFRYGDVWAGGLTRRPVRAGRRLIRVGVGRLAAR